MAITYPGTLDVFVNPAGTNTLDSPDHAQQHSDVNDAVEAGQAVLGTTAGTSVLKNFAAGDFPARINASNVLQQTIQGTINSSTLGTPTVTGGTFDSPTTTGTDAGTATLTNKTLTSPRVGTAITDTNGNEIIKTPATASAVNEITITNSATGDPVKIESTGGDTNIHLSLDAKGSALVKTKVLRQDGTTDSYTNNTVILTGVFNLACTSGFVGHYYSDSSSHSFGVTFSSKPIITCSCADSGGANSFAEVLSLSTTAFTVRRVGIASDADAKPIHWIAIGQLN